MKSIYPVLIACLLSTVLSFQTTSLKAQAIAPEKSAKAAADSDSRLIASDIQDNQDMMILAQKAADRGTDPRIKDLAQQMVTDHSGMLYAMQELKVARSGSSNQNKEDSISEAHKQAALLDAKLSNVSGSDFDATWVTGMVSLRQAKYEELAAAKNTVTNAQLKTAITEALPIIKKHLSQLKALERDFAKAAIQRKKAAQKKK